MITHSGINIAHEDGNVPTPTDIAVSMARMTRFGGSIWAPNLSHSVITAELVYRVEAARGDSFDFNSFCWALLHDAHEVVTGEVQYPWKPSQMKFDQGQLDARIASAYRINLKEVDLDKVKAADVRSLQLEGVSLGLPNFVREHERTYLKGDKFPVIPDEEYGMARAVLASAFRHVDVHDPLDSSAIRTFAGILGLIQRGDQVGAASVFRTLFDRVVVRF